jgi:hypothetical protein
MVFCHAAGASPLPPVRPGLWHVTSHATFDPDPQPGGTSWPFMSGKPRERSEDICLSESRAREPMPTPTGNGADPRVVAPDTVQVTASQPAEGRHGGGSTDWLYHRVDDSAFEGHWRLSTPGMSMRLDYQAHFVAAECGDVRPSSASKFGEP